MSLLARARTPSAWRRVGTSCAALTLLTAIGGFFYITPKCVQWIMQGEWPVESFVVNDDLNVNILDITDFGNTKRVFHFEFIKRSGGADVRTKRRLRLEPFRPAPRFRLDRPGDGPIAAIVNETRHEICTLINLDDGTIFHIESDWDDPRTVLLDRFREQGGDATLRLGNPEFIKARAYRESMERERQDIP